MSLFNPEKLIVTYLNGVKSTIPIIPRCYTLTHSDYSGELFLTIGPHYSWEVVNQNRDEVLGEWRKNHGNITCCLYLFLDQGQFDFKLTEKRDQVFRRELPLALSAIRYGDRALFACYPYLDHAPIIVHFLSTYSEFSKQENWGTFCQYKIEK